jgi:hypothetical protein
LKPTSRVPTRRTSMVQIKHFRAYARYLLSALAAVAFGITEN